MTGLLLIVVDDGAGVNCELSDDVRVFSIANHGLLVVVESPVELTD